MSQSRRIFYAVVNSGMAKDGTNTYTALHGVQSLGMNTRINLDPIFEQGQISLYDQPENVPDIEVTMEKVLDGYGPLWCQATNGATSPTLVGRSNIKCSLAVSIYGDTQNSASGTPVTQVVCSGLFVSQLSYNFPVQGMFTESITMVGNNKQWLVSGFTFTPNFTNTDTPVSITGSGGVNRRQDFIYYPLTAGGKYTVLPKDMPGVSSSGTNDALSDGSYPLHLQSVRTQCNLGREPMYELGRKGFYHRYINFPVEVRTDFEFFSTSGDLFNALESVANNSVAQTIKLYSREGTSIDLGTSNKCTSTTFAGANAGRQGGNATNQFSYQNFNDCSITHPADPSQL